MTPIPSTPSWDWRRRRAANFWLWFSSIRLWAGAGSNNNFTRELVGRTFTNQLLVDLAGVVIGFSGFANLRGRDPGRFLRPALVHSLESPLCAATRRANRLAIDDHEYWIGMCRRNDPRSDPAAAADRHLEF